MQPEFIAPDFIDNNSEEEIHQRMMNNLPDDIDNMPAGFPYDLTMPAAIEKSEYINYHALRTIMIAFPEYAWDEWLDLHGGQRHLTRHEARYATGTLLLTGKVGTKISSGTVFCTPATETSSSIGFMTDYDVEIGEEGTVSVEVTAVEPGKNSNVQANSITLMERPISGVVSVTNPESIYGGTDREEDDDYYDRIHEDYENGNSHMGNDADFKKWALEAGAGGCVVVTPDDNSELEPGVVQLILTDLNGNPANQSLKDDVYNYIISPDDRSKRKLPAGSAKLECISSTALLINYVCTSIVYDASVTSIEQIQNEFAELLTDIYAAAKEDNVLRYNDVRPLISKVNGVEDFADFLMNEGEVNIVLGEAEYPLTGTLSFS